MDYSLLSSTYTRYTIQLFPEQYDNIDLFLVELHYRSINTPCREYQTLLDYFIRKYKTPDYLISTEFQKMSQLVLDFKQQKHNGAWSLPLSMRETDLKHFLSKKNINSIFNAA